jgi:hypothetical protein
MKSSLYKGKIRRKNIYIKAPFGLMEYNEMKRNKVEWNEMEQNGINILFHCLDILRKRRTKLKVCGGTR